MNFWGNKRMRNFLFFLIGLFFIAGFSAQQKKKDEWTFSTRYVNVPYLNYMENPSERGKILGQFKRMDKLVIVNDGKVRDKNLVLVVHPVKAYTYVKYLLSEEMSKEIEQKELAEGLRIPAEKRWAVYEAVSNAENLEIRETQSDSSSLIKKITENDKVLLIKSGDETSYTKIVYPVHGFVRSEILDFSENKTKLNILFSVAPVNEYLESSLKNKSVSFGGNVEIANSSLDMTIGAGFSLNEVKSENLNMQTQFFYLYDRYNLVEITPEIKFHINAGLVYWRNKFKDIDVAKSGISFVKDYADGFGYMAGAGFIFEADNFIINCQYNFIGTNEAKYDVKILPFGISDKISLYHGSHQIQLMVGYSLGL